MRTALDIDDDILNAVKALAAPERQPIGQFASELPRGALREEAAGRRTGGRRGDGRAGGRASSTGSDPTAAGGTVVTNEVVNEIRDDLGG